MPSITFENVSKSFRDTQVITSFDAQIEDGEFVVLLGPSGCGKSTLLRMIAGLTDITSGTMRFDGEVVNEWEVAERRLAFVFQSYALYPHMTVRANIAFPLVMAAFKRWYHVPVVNSIARRTLMRSPEISERTARIATALELDQLLDRRPVQLSGGQRQRVALARALVRDPAIYLLDEPLSNLDAKLRTQMRAQITGLHREVGRTFVYVTHDQVEAMTMATRIIVMDHGAIQQIGTPDEIYRSPANTFVARFVGAPPMNLLPIGDEASGVRRADLATHVPGLALPDGDDLLLGIRPEKLRFHDDASGPLSATVVAVERLGSETLVGFHLDTAEDRPRTLAPETPHYAKVPADQPVTVGESCSLSFAAADVVWFDRETTRRLDPALV
ncbi:ABC transporter ATP-binding protein [Amycolatopsis sp. GM8]|uniref:ABC transporter ATP-binding protein n=1 Tax=Amycolatopsis sp. GM8 TaxID=2896530 RepID=UPI001F39BF48|nr:ABC transporter ATP-binding protein [Amycolatopsis sp. GM8]